jgi:hypothetical protein
VRQGNERHYAEGDIGPATVLAHALSLALERGHLASKEFADATDEALLARLTTAGDRQIAELVALLRQEPWRIVARKVAPGTGDGAADAPTSGQRLQTDPILVRLDGLYDAVPLLAGKGMPITQISTTAQAEMARVRELAGMYAVTWT